MFCSGVSVGEDGGCASQGREKPCPNHALFVPFSCLFRVRFVSRSPWLLIDPAHRPPPLVRRSSSIVIAWSLYHSPPRCAAGSSWRNTFLGNAVFDGETREKILDFLPGAQRGCCAWGRAAGDGRGQEGVEVGWRESWVRRRLTEAGDMMEGMWSWRS